MVPHDVDYSENDESLWRQEAMKAAREARDKAYVQKEPIMLFPYLKQERSESLDQYRNKDLTGFDLRRAKLRDFVFNDCILKYANFEGADLSGASFCKADLQEASFKGANLTNVKFVAANLQDANFAGATPAGRLRGGEVQPEQWVQRVGPTIKDLDLFKPGADLRNANLRGAKLANLDLRGANLNDADFTNAKLENCNLEGALLRRGLFWYTTLIGNFSRADFRGSSFNYASIIWSIDGATARGASFHNCTVKSIDGDKVDPATDFSNIFVQGNRKFFAEGLYPGGTKPNQERRMDAIHPE